MICVRWLHFLITDITSTHTHTSYFTLRIKISKRTAFLFFFAIADTLAIEQNNIDRWNIRRNSRFDNGRRFIGHMCERCVCHFPVDVKYILRVAREEPQIARRHWSLFVTACHYVTVNINNSFPISFFRNTSAKDRRCGTAWLSAWRKVSVKLSHPSWHKSIYFAIVKNRKKKKASSRYTIYLRETVSVALNPRS